MKPYIPRFPESLGPNYRRTEYGWEPVGAWKSSVLRDYMEMTEDELRAARRKLREEVEAKCRKRP